MIPLRGFSDYFFENISVGAVNQIQITSACNARCIFCSNEQNPFEICRSRFRSLDEIEKVIWSMPPQIQGSIALNESLPGRLSEGEALLHPELFEIIGAIRKKFNNEIRITTNGSLLTKETIEKLVKFLPITIQISFPTFNKENWCRVFNLKEPDFITAMQAFSIMKFQGINTYASITPMPSWLGWDDVDKTLEFLSNVVNFVLVYAPGYTDKTNPEHKDKFVYDKVELSNFLREKSRAYGFSYDWSLDPQTPLKVNPGILNQVMSSAFGDGARHVLWCTSTAAFERFSDIILGLAHNYPMTNQVMGVENKTYGGNIECAGLWMINDLRLAVQDYIKVYGRPDVIHVPYGFVDRYGFDLSSENILDFIKELGDTRLQFISA